MTRKEAIKWLKTFKGNTGMTELSQAFDVAIKALEQEPKIGHWKHNKCDMCGASRPPLFDNYCSNCGAKMEVEE